MTVEGQVVDDVQVVVQGEPTTETVDDSQHSMGVDLDRAHEVAKEFIAERDAEREGKAIPEPTAPTTRDDKGRFVAKETTPEEAAPVEAEAAPALDPVWAEAAKQEGLTGSYTSQAEVQNAIIANRLTKLQSLGINADEFARFRQYENQGSPQQQPAQQPDPAETPPQANDEFNVELDTDLDDSVTGPLKQIIDRINKVEAASLAREENSRKEREQEFRQRGEAVQVAQQQSDNVAQFDAIVAKIPGFVEHFGGTAAEMDALLKTQPNDPRSRRFHAWGVAHLKPAYDRNQGILGQTARALELSIKEAWAESGFAGGSSPSTNSSTNGAATLRPGSVIPMSSPSSLSKSDAGETDSLDGQYDTALRAVKDAWISEGGNPFSRDL